MRGSARYDVFVHGIRGRPLADDEVVAHSGNLRVTLVRPVASFRALNTHSIMEL